VGVRAFTCVLSTHPGESQDHSIGSRSRWRIDTSKDPQVSRIFPTAVSQERTRPASYRQLSTQADRLSRRCAV